MSDPEVYFSIRIKYTYTLTDTMLIFSTTSKNIIYFFKKQVGNLAIR